LGESSLGGSRLSQGWKKDWYGKFFRNGVKYAAKEEPTAGLLRISSDGSPTPKEGKLNDDVLAPVEGRQEPQKMKRKKGCAGRGTVALNLKHKRRPVKSNQFAREQKTKDQREGGYFSKKSPVKRDSYAG